MLLVFAMILSVISTNYIALAAESAESAEASLSDIEQSYAKAEIAALVDKNIIDGFEDGTFKPNDSMTRAQLAKVLVLSLGLAQDAEGAAGFKDIESGNWFAGYVGALVKSGITQGTSSDAFSPNKTVSREELAVFFVRAFGWAKTAEETDLDERLTDLTEVSNWAKASVSFAYKIGFIKGVANADGTVKFNPSGSADRQALARLAYEFVVNRAVYEDQVKLLTKEEEKPVKETSPSQPGGGGSDPGSGSDSKTVNAPGEYAFGSVSGNVNINVPGVTLRNTTIAGNLLLNEGIGEGDVTLDNVTVAGETSVLGGGANSIHVVNSILATVIVNKSDGSIRLVLEDGTNVQQIQLESGALIETSAAVGEIGPVEVTSAVPHNAEVTFNGSFDSIRVHAEQVAINLAANATIGEISVFEQALNATFNLDAGAVVTRAIVDAVVSFTGSGTIQSSQVNVDGVNFDDLANKPVIEADPTVTSTVYTPEEFELTAVDATKQIVFTGIKDSGSVKDITLAAAWSSEDDTVAEVVYGKVKAKTDGTTYINASYGAYNIKVPVTVNVYKPGEAYPTISSVQVSNGTIDITFDGSPEELGAEHFIVSATLNGAAYELQNLQYSNGRITFDPVNTYGSTLYITVDSDADKTKFAGSQSGQIKLTGFGGHIKNVAGEAVQGLTIQFRKGLNAKTGTVVGAATTDADGNYFIYLEPGIYTGELGGGSTPYITTYLIGVSAVNVKNMDQHQTAIGIPNASETRIVLTWGKDPQDLDSHLIGPSLDGGQFHTWYADQQYWFEDGLVVDLDLDDTTSYGPETTTIRQDVAGTYKFYVHHYYGTSTIKASEAKIEVYRGPVTTPTKVYAVPSGTGSEIYWIVFEMTVNADGSVSFNDVNEFTNVNPVPNQHGNETEIDQ
ncbi:S-layer homology domain-containing protein [Paenibacillus arenilitoris]|uniref:S-layer homology domain-containing protein n=1 Tax=Paenibacillus arenilitoris TaxID=2772299 RepID=A0A927CJ12_9BACL|nr:S-layer homology domain-containing protein [Paenibacillus arenilitoris]MBD2867987.1 S-layer homology domain-containing protein [Paenibacillus arenilitoris]